MSKNIAEIIKLPISRVMTKEYAEYTNYFLRMEEKILAIRVEQMDSFVLKQLYDSYKDTDISKILVIDKEQFEYFLKKYLPLYLREEEE